LCVGRAVLVDAFFVRENVMDDLSKSSVRITGKKYIESKTSLVSKNITVLGRRTSVRLEPEMWQALKHISKREECSIHDLCSLISLRKKEETSLTAAIRVFLMLFYRASSTENGHVKAGNGDFQNMKRRAGMAKDWNASSKPKRGADDFSVETRLSPHLQLIESAQPPRRVAQ
jgi:predicted DNA-binding ribbon-helix-helix protein